MTAIKKKTLFHSLPASAGITSAHHAATNRLGGMRRLFLMSASAATLTAFSAGSAAAQVFWTGTTSTDWTTGTNWSGGAVPIAGNTVTIRTTSPNPTVLGVGAPAVGTTGQILVGNAGSAGNLTIENGSTLTSSGGAVIASDPGSNGTVTVTGAGSQWIVSGGQIEVGSSGNGTLNIQNGAQIVAQTGVFVGDTAGGTGTLNINGGSTLETNSLGRPTNSSAQVNFDNAILRARINNAVGFIGGFLPGNLNIAAGGLTVDTQAFTVGLSSTIAGVGALTKIGAGTFNLRAANIYTGETVIQAGTLGLTGSGSIAASSRVVANGTFNISAITPAGTDIQSLAGSGTVTRGVKNLIITNANDTFAGIIDGSGTLTVTGGTQTLSGANAYTGATFVSGTGTLRAGAINAFSAASAYTASAGGTFDLNGFNQTIASLDNAGTVRTGGAPGTLLTIAGNYVGSGGTVQLNTKLSGDASPTDRLLVQGATSGSSTLRVVNVGGTGAQTGEGIKLVDVVGASNGAFALQGNYVFQGQQAVVGGAYAYTLQKNGIATPGDGDWYLRSSLINPPPGAPAGPLYQPGVPLYEAYPQVLLALNSLSTMRERVGDRARGEGDAFASFGAPADVATMDGSAWWGRTEGWKNHIEPKSSSAGASHDTNQVKVQTGLDALLQESGAGRLLASVYLQYGTASSEVRSFYGNGTLNIESYAAAATLTWLGHNGFYVDAQAQATVFDGTLHSSTAGYNVVEGDDAKGYALGVESGWRIPMDEAWSVTPQAQLVWSKVDFKFGDVFGAQVSLKDGESLIGRGGVALEHRSAWRDPARGLVSANVYGIANLYYEFLDGTSTDVAGVTFASAQDRLWGGLGVGGNYAWRDGRYALFAEALATTSLDNFSDSYGYKGTAGFKMRW